MKAFRILWFATAFLLVFFSCGCEDFKFILGFGIPGVSMILMSLVATATGGKR